MQYFAQINSKDELQKIDPGKIIKDEYGSTDVQNIEVSQEYYNNAQQYGNNYYIYSNGKIIVNPEYETIKLNEAKQAKYDENDTKASVFRHSQTFTLTIQEQECVFDTTEQTQSDLNTATNFCLASGGTYDGWVTNNGVELDLTLEDIALIGAEFKIKANVYDKWNEYRQAIDEATTVEEVETIEINYEEDVNENENTNEI